MILDDIQTQHIGDELIGKDLSILGYICTCLILPISLFIVGHIFLFVGDFQIIFNNMKTMSNILLIIYCSLFLKSFKWIILCFTKNLNVIYA